MAQEVLNMKTNNTDGWNYKGEPLDFNGYLPTYKKLKNYDHLFSASENKDYFKGTGFDTTVKLIPNIIKQNSFQVRELSKHLKANTEAQSIFNIWHFLVTNIMYDFDKNGNEELRRPSRSWSDRHTGVDCDCFAILASAIMLEMGIEPILEIVAFNNREEYGHIYVITKSDLILDPVMKEFNQRPDNITKTLHMPINNYELAGVPATNGLGAIRGLGTIAPPTERTLQLMQMQSKLLQMPVTDARTRELRKLNYAIKLNGTIEQEIFLAIQKTVYDIDKDFNLIFVNEANAIVAAKAVELFEQKLNELGVDGLGSWLSNAWEAITGAVSNVVNAVTGAIGNFVGPKISALAQALYDKATAVLLKYNPVSLIARNSYLGLLALNYKGQATKLSNDANALEAFKEIWVKKFGGNWQPVLDAVNNGKNKSQLFGLGSNETDLQGLGLAPAAIGAAIVAATPIILAVASLLKDILKKSDIDKDVKDLPKDETILDDDANSDGYSNDDERNQAKGIGTYLPWIIGGVGVTLLAYMAFKPKGK